jgi:hypothetical protein
MLHTHFHLYVSRNTRTSGRSLGTSGNREYWKEMWFHFFQSSKGSLTRWRPLRSEEWLSQEIAWLSWNPEVHYLFYEMSSLVLSRICRENSKFHYNLTTVAGALHEAQYTFSIISHQILFTVWTVSGKVCRENQNTHFVFNFFFRNSCHLWNYVKQIVESDRPQTTTQCDACALHAGYLRLQKTPRICNTYCFFHGKNGCTNAPQFFPSYLDMLRGIIPTRFWIKICRQFSSSLHYLCPSYLILHPWRQALNIIRTRQ